MFPVLFVDADPKEQARAGVAVNHVSDPQERRSSVWGRASMILITGAAGKTGQAVIRALVRHSGPIQWTQTIEQGVYLMPCAAETRLAIVDLEDIAVATSIVLTELGHAGATHELAGPDLPVFQPLLHLQHTSYCQ